MKQTHFIGLNKRAEGWLKKYCNSIDYQQITQRTYSDGSVKKWASTGTEIDGVPTNRVIYESDSSVIHVCMSYPLANESGIVEEYVQQESWVKGPVIFLALRFMDTRKPIRVSMWSDDEINLRTTMIAS